MPPVLATSDVYNRVSDMEDGSYRLISEYAGAKLPIKLLHKPCGSVIEVIAKGFLQEGAGRCKTCAPQKRGHSTRRVTEEEMLRDFSVQLGEEYTYLGGFTTMAGATCQVRHAPCGTEWAVSPKMLLGKKQRRCPTCANLQRGSHLRSPTYLEELLRERALEGVYRWMEPYGGDNKAKLRILHIECGRESTMRPNDLQQGYHCPACSTVVSSSFGCEEINSELKRLGVAFVREHAYPDCRHVNALRFDFRIDLGGGEDLLIEYDGVQHSRPTFGGPNEFAKTQIRDKIKDDYCAERPHLHLHRIDYRKDARTELRLILGQYFHDN